MNEHKCFGIFLHKMVSFCFIYKNICIQNLDKTATKVVLFCQLGFSESENLASQGGAKKGLIIKNFKGEKKMNKEIAIQRKLNKVLSGAKMVMILLVASCVVLGMLALNVTKADEVDASDFNNMMSTFISIYNTIIMPTLTTLGIMVFAIAGFSNFLKLKSVSDEGEREKAKKSILWWLIGVVGSIAVLWLVPTLIGVAKGWFGKSTIMFLPI